MTATETELLPVTQEDRDAAAVYVSKLRRACGYLKARFHRDFSASARRGHHDDSNIIQAFARHRINTRPSIPAGGELAGKELFDAVAAYLRRRGHWHLEFVLSGDGGYEATERTKEGYETVAALTRAPSEEAVLCASCGGLGEVSDGVTSAVCRRCDGAGKTALASLPSSGEGGGVTNLVDALRDIASIDRAFVNAHGSEGALARAVERANEALGDWNESAVPKGCAQTTDAERIRGEALEEAAKVAEGVKERAGVAWQSPIAAETVRCAADEIAAAITALMPEPSEGGQ